MALFDPPSGGSPAFGYSQDAPMPAPMANGQGRMPGPQRGQNLGLRNGQVNLQELAGQIYMIGQKVDMLLSTLQRYEQERENRNAVVHVQRDESGMIQNLVIGGPGK